MTRDYVLHNHLNFISSLAGRTNAPRKNEQDFYFSLTLKVTEIPKLLFWSNSWVTALVFHNRFLIININLMTVAMHSSSETQGQSVGSGERAGRTFFKYGRKSPWITTLIELFPKIQADAGSWLDTKNALYHCAQSANSFFWVLFVSSYATAIVLPHLSGPFTKLVRAGETFIFYFPD